MRTMNIYSIWISSDWHLKYDDWNMSETARMFSDLDEDHNEHTLAVL